MSEAKAGAAAVPLLQALVMFEASSVAASLFTAIATGQPLAFFAVYFFLAALKWMALYLIKMKAG